EQGAVGEHGLKESEVNLGVALYLWGLLRDAGAAPVLTRSTDTSVFKDAVFSLKKDLQARADLSNRNNADLFISIHHDADIKNRNRNDLAIYYKMSDLEQSRDIARNISNALKENLGAKSAKIQAGNYHVLRTTDAPAILGEGSFMTNKKNEAVLSYTRTLTCEAVGYFLGILTYYQKGIPSISGIYPQDVTLTAAQPAITADIHPGADNASIDPGSVELTLDGKTVTGFSRDNKGHISYTPSSPLANGVHQFSISGRNNAGNSSGKRGASFTVSLPPSRISLVPAFPVIPADPSATTPVYLEVFDSLTRPVIDGTEVQLSATGALFETPSVLTKGGKARIMLTPYSKPGDITITAKAGEAVSQCTVRVGTPEQALLLFTIHDTSGNSVEKAALTQGERQVSYSDAAGIACDSLKYTGPTSYVITKKGYLPLLCNITLAPGQLTTANLILEAVDDGVFFNRTVMLDPEGASGMSSPILKYLKEKIENAGGKAVLAWEKAPAPSDNKKVLKSAEVRADIFISVEITGGEKASSNYYYKSPQGEELSRLMCIHLQEHQCLKGRKCVSNPATYYTLVQTAMPAVRVCLPKKTLTNPEGTADCLYKALVNFYRK
ncbi:MAG: N-acetylmuramoyl-L-alanine amidase, partial [Pseudomonadota bacterium]